MNKKQELEKLEELFMMFGVSLGTFGKIVGEQDIKDESNKLLAWQIGNKLENLYTEIEKDIDFLKELNK